MCEVEYLETYCALQVQILSSVPLSATCKQGNMRDADTKSSGHLWALELGLCEGRCRF